MSTLRVIHPFAIACLAVSMFAQVASADTDAVQTGRLRTLFRRQQSERQNEQQQPQKPKADYPNAVPRKPAPVANARQESQIKPVIVPNEKADPLLVLAERAIGKTSQRYLDANDHTPWQIMHGMVALRNDFVLTRGNGKVNCVEFLSNAPKFRGEYWWQVTEHGGRAHPFSVPYAFEGHANQFLALLSMSNLPLNHQFNVDGRRTVTMADMINNARMTVNDREEITWTLWFLTHYTDIDSEWTNAAGEDWSMERLVQMQTNAEVTTAPCGGCHGLFAIAYARNAFLQKHGEVAGVYRQADYKLNRYIAMTRSMQNYDGSFSTEFYKGPGHSRDFNERIKASGHILEWLMMALPKNRLNEPWVRKAVASISTDLIHNASRPAECGPLYHSLNSLIMYRDRVKPAQTPTQEPAELAEQSTGEEPGITIQENDPADAPVAVTEPSRVTQEVKAPAMMKPEVEAVDPQPTLARVPAKAEPTPALEEETTPAPSVVFAPQEEAAPEKTRRSFSKTMSRKDLLSRKAARRLAAMALDSEKSAEEQPSNDDQLPPLRFPKSRKTRMAIEPDGRVIR